MLKKKINDKKHLNNYKEFITSLAYKDISLALSYFEELKNSVEEYHSENLIYIYVYISTTRMLSMLPHIPTNQRKYFEDNFSSYTNDVIFEMTKNYKYSDSDNEIIYPKINYLNNLIRSFANNKIDVQAFHQKLIYLLITNDTIESDNPMIIYDIKKTFIYSILTTDICSLIKPDCVEHLKKYKFV